MCETRFIRANFADALPRLVDQGLRADAILMDLGLSSMQVDRPERGFSYSRQAPLDMRMDPSRPGSAADLVADTPERELADIMRTFGEERYARPIARAIVRRRAADAHHHHRRPGGGGALGRADARPSSPAATRPSASSRRCGSPSTTSSGAWSPASTPRSRCSPPAGAWR